MTIFDTEEWGKIVDTLNRRKEKIFKKILEKNPGLNDMKYTERDILITEYEILEIIKNWQCGKDQKMTKHKNF